MPIYTKSMFLKYLNIIAFEISTYILNNINGHDGDSRGIKSRNNKL